MSEELIAYIVLATTMAIGVALVWLIATPRKSAQSDVLAVDRKHLAHRVRRYVLAYSNANDNEKNETRKALNQAASKCRQDAGVSAIWDSPEEQRTIEDDTGAVILASHAAIKVVLDYDVEGAMAQHEPVLAFTIDTYAVVAMAYRHCVHFYDDDRHLKQLGDAAIKLLSLAEGRNKLRPPD